MQMRAEYPKTMKFESLERYHVKYHPAAPDELMAKPHFVFRQGQLQVPDIDFQEWQPIAERAVSEGTAAVSSWNITWLRQPLEKGEVVVIAGIDGTWFWRWDSSDGRIDQVARETRF